MLDAVRSTVLTILNKNNYGSLNVSDFNRLAKMSQLEIFMSYTKRYNDFVNMQNQMTSGEDYADELDIIQSNLETFLVYDQQLTVDGSDRLPLPSEVTTGDKLYQIMELKLYKDGTLYSVSEKVSIGAFNSADLMGESSMEFPLHTVYANFALTSPKSNTFDWRVDYLRHPKDPKWTYESFAGGAPIFNPSANDFQDLEVGQDDFVDMVIKVCKYAGLVIREADVTQTMAREEMINKQK